MLQLDFNISIIIDSLTKLLLPVTADEKTRNEFQSYKNLRRDIKVDFANEKTSRKATRNNFP